MKKLLFLGYGPDQTSLLSVISDKGWQVRHEEDPVSDLGEFNLVVSYGYRHILKAGTLATAQRPPLNLHIAYLPYNRGAHPLFWAAYDGTPAGVTIHEIDAGVDTGPICFQEQVPIDLGADTFSSGYGKLINAMEGLFLAHIDELLAGNYVARPQVGQGTTHKVRDLPKGFTWSETIGPTIRRLKNV